jgi:hypothetical protein
LPRQPRLGVPGAGNSKEELTQVIVVELVVYFFTNFFIFYLHLPSFAFSSLHLPSLERGPRGGLERFLAVPPGRPAPAGAGCGMPERKLMVPTFLTLEE